MAECGRLNDQVGRGIARGCEEGHSVSGIPKGALWLALPRLESVSRRIPVEIRSVEDPADGPANQQPSWPSASPMPITSPSINLPMACITTAVAATLGRPLATVQRVFIQGLPGATSRAYLPGDSIPEYDRHGAIVSTPARARRPHRLVVSYWIGMITEGPTIQAALN